LFRKSTKLSDRPVSALAKSLVLKWRRFVPEKKTVEQGRQNNDELDHVRLQARKLLALALMGEGAELPVGVCRPVEELAESIENAIFGKFKDTDAKYKIQVRSRVFNLKVRVCV
jgi:hypothetical protein